MLKHFREIKKQLGSRYAFHCLISEQEAKSLKEKNPSSFEMQTAAVLIAGCVKIEITLYKQNGKVKSGYDIFVKDCPDSPEWICYDSPNDAVSFREEDIFNVLDRIVEENALSYTECCFDKLEGKVVKPKKDIKDVNGL